MTKETEKAPLKLNRGGRLELRKTVETGQVRQSFSHGRSKTVTVEVKKKRNLAPGAASAGGQQAAAPAPEAPEAKSNGAAAQARSEQPRGRAPSRGEGRPASSGQGQGQGRGEREARRDDGRRDDGRRDRSGKGRGSSSSGAGAEGLTKAEREMRARVLDAARREAERKKREEEEEAKRKAAEAERQKQAEEEAKRLAEQEAERHRIEEEARRQLEEEEAAKQAAKKGEEQPASAEAAPQAEADKADSKTAKKAKSKPAAREDDELPEAEVEAPAATPEAGIDLDELGGRIKRRKKELPKVAQARNKDEPKRRMGKLTIAQALDGESEEERQRSLASVRRQREKLKQMMEAQQNRPSKVVREVVVPETITVNELANRMAERGGEVVKTLMKMGVMATINQIIDADTAELVVEEYGHKIKRVSAADVELGLTSEAPERDEDLQQRAPVVTIMGHVDHGKTSLLDALRQTDVAAGEAGGITQHIGAYQVTLESGDKITFLDTPGHAAFTQMRARGAEVTDIVVLVVAADDGIMEQTVEAIAHAKAAKVPIIVAINKMDKPDANPDRVRQALLSHELVVEEMGGDIQTVEVSALKKSGLYKLEEAILLQAELLELKANPSKTAEGIIVESRLDRGRGPVATVLVQSGTLKQGDIFIAGAEWGRARALLNDKGEQVEAAGPSMPVEVLGLQGTPLAGDQLVTVESEARAREVVDFRQRRRRDVDLAKQSRGTLDQMLSRIREGEAKTLPVVVKSDVHGSTEAIVGALEKLGNDEVRVQVLHAGVGAISESDVTLAQATGAMVIGFNVRANPQARDQARRDNIDIRYYSIIYEVVDDVKAALTGLLSPEARENFLGYAEIRAVFDITKAGKVAGCMITEGMVRRGAKVRLLRDDVVVHQGSLRSLRRFKDEVREVSQGYECGMAFENYQDIQVGDRIECYEVQEVARVL